MGTSRSIQWNGPWWERPKKAFTVKCRCRKGERSASYYFAGWEYLTSPFLTDEDIAECDDLAYDQREEAREKRLPDSVLKKPEHRALWAHVVGMRGEKAWARANHIKWPKRIGSYKELPDFDPDIEIRTGGQGYPNMVIRDKEMREIPDRRFVACVLHPDGYYRFHGWCYAYEFKRYPKSDIGGKGVPNRFIHVDDLHRLPFHKPKQ